jgi:ribose-phosphate pyrophosphokinase
MIKLNSKEVLFETFPNGETKLVMDNVINNMNKMLVNKVLMKYENDLDLMRLKFVKDYSDALGYYTELILTHMPYGRMDRSENNSPFTLKYVANFINSLKFNEVTVIEPHSDVTCALLDNVKSIYTNFELLKRVKENIGFDEDNDYLMFPDAGASKRYSKMKAKNILIGHKTRNFQTGKIESLNLIGTFDTEKYKRVIIVDDLSSYGGTFVRSAEALRAVNFKEVYLLVTHAENSIFKGELFNHIDKVFTTNSMLTEQDNLENEKFKEKLKIYDIEEVLLNDEN